MSQPPSSAPTPSPAPTAPPQQQQGYSAGAPQPTPQALQMLQLQQSMTKERIQTMLARMQQLRSQGFNEQTSPELVQIMGFLRMFAQMQRQQQAHQQHQQHQQAQVQASAAQGQPASPAAAINGAAPAPSTSAPPTSTSAAAAAPAPGSFSPAQLAQLKSQIQAYKLMSHNLPVPADVQQAALNPSAAAERAASADGAAPPPPEDGVGERTVGAAVAVAQASPAPPTPAENGEQLQQQAQPKTENGAAPTPKVEEAQPAAPSEPPQEGPYLETDTSSAIYPYNSYVHPFTYLQAGPPPRGTSLAASKQQRLVIPSVMPMGLDPYVLAEERNRFVDARVQQRIRELEALPSLISDEPPSDPSVVKDENASAELPQLEGSAKMRALIELKSLRLLERQKALRQDVVDSMTHASTLATDRTAFRRFKKQTLRDARVTEQLERKQRTERDKKTKQKHLDYLQSINAHGDGLKKAGREAVAKSVKLGRAVVRLHMEVEKEEQKRIERIAKERLRALKNDDEEAYLKLIDTAKDTRITHLLSQTDAYLDSLAQAVVSQQNEIGPEEQAQLGMIGEFETEDGPANESMFGAIRQDDAAEDTGKVDYYAVAHRIQEKVTQQPSILVGGQLKEYQIKGLQWMISLYNNRLNGILADEMGLGKTIQTISLVTFLIEKKRQNGPYLIIVPLSTLTNWTLEFEKWAPSVAVQVYKGPPVARKAIQNRMRQQGFQVLLTTFEYIIKDRPVLSKYKWVHMIMDEGHRLKNTESKLSQTLTQFYMSRYRLILTGTPLQNNLPELWALLNFVLPKIFNSVKSFDEWFNTPFANTGSQEKIEINEEESLLIIKRLHKVLRPFLLRRLKKDVEKDLPDKVEKVIKCRMSGLQMQLYSQMKKHGVLAAENNDPKGKKMGIRGLQNTIMQLRKICNHPYVFEQVEATVNPTKASDANLYRTAGKFELLDRILPKLKATGHRVLIFFQMTAIMNIMEDYLHWRGFTYLRLDGSTKTDDRSQLLKMYNDPESDYFVFLLSTRAGGLGLNLQTADTVIIFDSDWNPHADLQAQDRAHRIGQKKEVRILRLITEKSVEEQILARAQYKLEIDGKVIQAGKFDNKSTAEEREEFLRSLLEGDNDDEEEEEAGDLDDNELNEVIARGDAEVGIFAEIDKQRERDELKTWRDAGNKGPHPGRLISDAELPEIYRSDHVFNPLEDEIVGEEGRGARLRGPVHYDDGLTEDQFLQALEDDGADINEVIAQKRERKEKRAANKLARSGGQTPDVESPGGEVEPPPKKRRGRPPKSVSAAALAAEAAAAGTPVSGKRKRNPVASTSMTPSLNGDDDDEPPPTTKQKRRKGNAAAGVDSATKDLIRSVLQQLLEAMYNVQDPADGRLRCELFRELPNKKAYPDYFALIQRPIALNRIKRNIERKTYLSVAQGRDDFHLMFNNARTYNEPGSWVYNDADAMQAVFDPMYESLVANSGLPGAEEGLGASAIASGTGAPSTASASPAPKQTIKLKLGGGKGSAANTPAAADSDDDEDGGDYHVGSDDED